MKRRGLRGHPKDFLGREKLAKRLAETVFAGRFVVKKEAYLTARIVVEKVLDAIIDGVARDGHVKIRGFGCFYRSDHKARLVMNPRTRMTWWRPPVARVRFKPYNGLKDAVNGIEKTEAEGEETPATD